MKTPTLQPHSNLIAGGLMLVVFGGGAALAMLVGGPAWLSAGYTAIGLVLALPQLVVRGQRRERPRAEPRPTPAVAYSRPSEPRFSGQAHELRDLCAACDLRLQNVVWSPAQARLVVDLVHISASMPDLAELLSWLDEQQLTLTTLELGLEPAKLPAELSGVDPHAWARESLRAAGLTR